MDLKVSVPPYLWQPATPLKASPPTRPAVFQMNAKCFTFKQHYNSTSPTYIYTVQYPLFAALSSAQTEKVVEQLFSRPHTHTNTWPTEPYNSIILYTLNTVTPFCPSLQLPSCPRLCSCPCPVPRAPCPVPLPLAPSCVLSCRAVNFFNSFPS